MQGWQIRPAEASELGAILAIFYENEFRDEPEPPPQLALPYLAHVLATGRVLVAERAGRLIGYAGLMRRGEVAFLSDLFVRPDGQSAGVGRALLRAILPPGGIHSTCSSSDPRARALYIRAGMRPQWPQFWLRGASPVLAATPPTDLTLVEGDPDDPALVAWEERCGGRHRPEDLDFWLREQRGVPLWFRRGGRTLGYAVVRLGAATAHYPEAAAVGPVGVAAREDAAGCLLAAVDWARSRAPIVQLVVPGPHPSPGATDRRRVHDRRARHLHVERGGAVLRSRPLRQLGGRSPLNPGDRTGRAGESAGPRRALIGWDNRASLDPCLAKVRRCPIGPTARYSGRSSSDCRPSGRAT